MPESNQSRISAGRIRGARVCIARCPSPPRRGDQGSTDLLFGHCVLKNHPRIHALGAVDELNAALGLVRVTAKTEIVLENVPKFQMELIALMGELATPRGEEEHYAKTHPQRIDAACVERLDELVKTMEAQGALKFEGWALPGAGGSLGGAHCDVARTVCRRAERAVMDLHGTERRGAERGDRAVFEPALGCAVADGADGGEARYDHPRNTRNDAKVLNSRIGNFRRHFACFADNEYHS